MTILDPRIDAYAAAHSTPFPEYLERLDAETREALPSPEMLSGPVVGRLLESLVFAVRPRLVIEIGTYSGYSALAMAGGLPPGARIITLEVSDRHADFAQRHIDASPHADRIQIRRGPALDSLAAIDGPYDFVFIDADKSGYAGYYEEVLPKLSDQGLIAVDNTLRDGNVLDPASGNESDRAIAAFNDLVAHDERVDAVQLTVRDGVTIIRKRSA